MEVTTTKAGPGTFISQSTFALELQTIFKTYSHNIQAKRDFKKDSVIGRIKGKVVSDESLDPNYVMELANDKLLVPKAPFRYLNHSCRPNCEIFDWEDEKPDSKTGVKELHLGVIRKVEAGDELTIDYAWPADLAMPCHCGSKKCRGYIVDKEQLHLMV